VARPGARKLGSFCKIKVFERTVEPILLPVSL